MITGEKFFEKKKKRRNYKMNFCRMSIEHIGYYAKRLTIFYSVLVYKI